MKTLDEVIKAQERCGTYPNCHFCFLHAGPVCEWIRDALHYLKEYQAILPLVPSLINTALEVQKKGKTIG